MNVIIVEDEISATKNMVALLKEIDEGIVVVACIQSVEDAVFWIENNAAPELAFCDIQLADGLSFEIFEKTSVSFPVIFTTAYNEYALKAFKVNSIDYLLKPIKKQELIFAINKYKGLLSNVTAKNEDLLSTFQNIRTELRQIYKKVLLVKKYNGLIPVAVVDFAYFSIENGIVYGYTFNEARFVIDEILDVLEKQLPPADFFRANRQFIVSRKSIKEAQNYFNRRFVLKIVPQPAQNVLVSKAKIPLFKDWLG